MSDLTTEQENRPGWIGVNGAQGCRVLIARVGRTFPHKMTGPDDPSIIINTKVDSPEVTWMVPKADAWYLIHVRHPDLCLTVHWDNQNTTGDIYMKPDAVIHVHQGRQRYTSPTGWRI